MPPPARETTENYLVSRGNEPRYMLDTHGAWIVENGQLKQENASSVNQWNGGDPATIVGDWRWMDYSASIDVTLPGAEASRYERLTIRAQTGMNWNNSGYTLEINGAGSWKLYRIGTQIASGTVTKNAEGKYNLKLVGLGDTVYALHRWQQGHQLYRCQPDALGPCEDQLQLDAGLCR